MSLFSFLSSRIASFWRDLVGELAADDCSSDVVPRSADRSGSTKPKDRLGIKGEELAQKTLIERRYAILERNIVLDGCEIDIVAEKSGTLIFVEVKTRTTRDYDADPADAVDEKRRRRMIRAAKAYRRWRRREDAPVRFDIVAVLCPKNGQLQIDHHIGAFDE